MRRYHLYVFVGILSLALVAAGVMMAFAQPNFAKVKEYRIERSVPPEAQACIDMPPDHHTGRFLLTGPKVDMPMPISPVWTAI